MSTPYNQERQQRRMAVANFLSQMFGRTTQTAGRLPALSGGPAGPMMAGAQAATPSIMDLLTRSVKVDLSPPAPAPSPREQRLRADQDRVSMREAAARQLPPGMVGVLAAGSTPSRPSWENVPRGMPDETPLQNAPQLGMAAPDMTPYQGLPMPSFPQVPQNIEQGQNTAPMPNPGTIQMEQPPAPVVEQVKQQERSGFIPPDQEGGMNPDNLMLMMQAVMQGGQWKGMQNVPGVRSKYISPEQTQNMVANQDVSGIGMRAPANEAQRRAIAQQLWQMLQQPGMAPATGPAPTTGTPQAAGSPPSFMMNTDRQPTAGNAPVANVAQNGTPNEEAARKVMATKSPEQQERDWTNLSTVLQQQGQDPATLNRERLLLGYYAMQGTGDPELFNAAKRANLQNTANSVGGTFGTPSAAAAATGQPTPEQLVALRGLMRHQGVDVSKIKDEDLLKVYKAQQEQKGGR
jgi:hypothetical protein